MKAAVVLSSWKMKFFEKELAHGEFEYERHDIHEGNLKDCIVLQVQTETAAELQPYVERANAAAARSKRH